MNAQTEIPVPPVGRRRVWPFAEMKVGESIFFPGITLLKATGASSSARNHHGFEFAHRTVIEGGAKGVRVWRTK